MEEEYELDKDYNDWGNLIIQIRPVIRKAILKHVYNLDADTLKELEQEVLVKIYNKFYLFKKDFSLKDWVYVISVNHIIDFLRKKRSYTFSKNVSELNISTTNHQNTHISVCQMLKVLPREYRILLVKKYIHGFKQKEIAAEMNLPIGTVGSKIQVGIKMLKTIVQKEGLSLSDF
jgi:RNA polymerase sigma-70 factor (ECF subfamily)